MSASAHRRRHGTQPLLPRSARRLGTCRTAGAGGPRRDDDATRMRLRTSELRTWRGRGSRRLERHRHDRPDRPCRSHGYSQQATRSRARPSLLPSGSDPSVVRVPIGDWPSGLYVARLRGPGGEGLAPFVVRPRRLGEHRVAIVLPTNTWQAYNLRDVDGNGVGDSWYAHPGVASVDLAEAVSRTDGVPPRFQRLRPWLPALARAAPDRGGLPRRRRPRAGRDRGSARAALRPDRLPRTRGVRDHACLRRDRAVPRPGREPRLPLLEQLLLPRRAARAAPVQDRQVARPRSSRGCARRRAVRRLEPEPLSEQAVHGHRGVAGGLAVRGHAPAERGSLRALRDRDRRADIRLAAR